MLLSHLDQKQVVAKLLYTHLCACMNCIQQAGYFLLLECGTRLPSVLKTGAEMQMVSSLGAP